MHRRAIFSLVGLIGLALGGCAISQTPQGVLPRTEVSPPPSVARNVPNRATIGTAGTTTSAIPQRQGLSVPSRLTTPRP